MRVPVVESAPNELKYPMRSDTLPNAQHFREEAHRIRSDAEHVTDEMVRNKLLDIAGQYDKLAESVDDQSR